MEDKLEELWTAISFRRYFLIPSSLNIPDGSFSIRTPVGTRRNVNLDFIASFEITLAEAEPYIKAELEHALSKAKYAFTTWAGFAAIAQGKPIPNDQSPQRPKNPFAALLDIPQEELNENPDAVKENWQSLIGGFQDLLKGATSDDPKDLDKANFQMQRLQNHLQPQGIKVDDAIQNLPNTLREKYNTSDADPTLKASAEKFQEATQYIGHSFQDLLHALKDGASKIHDAIEEAEANSRQSKSTEPHNHSDGNTVNTTRSEEDRSE